MIVKARIAGDATGTFIPASGVPVRGNVKRLYGRRAFTIQDFSGCRTVNGHFAILGDRALAATSRCSAAFVLPLILFAVSGRHQLSTYPAMSQTKRIERTVNVLHEHGLKVFETVERIIAETNEDRRVACRTTRSGPTKKQLHERLRVMVESLPQLKSLWIFSSPMAVPW